MCRRVSVSVRPLADSRYSTLHAGKRPFIRDGARVALRLAEMGLSRLGDGCRTPAYRRPQNLSKFLPVSSRNWATSGFIHTPNSVSLKPAAAHLFVSVVHEGTGPIHYSCGSISTSFPLSCSSHCLTASAVPPVFASSSPCRSTAINTGVSSYTRPASTAAAWMRALQRV